MQNSPISKGGPGSGAYHISSQSATCPSSSCYAQYSPSATGAFPASQNQTQYPQGANQTYYNQPQAEYYYSRYGSDQYPAPYGQAENYAPAAASGIAGWFDFSNGAYLKGLLVGAGLTLILTNSTVQKTMIRTAVKTWSLVQGGVEEVKEQFRDVNAEMSQE